MIRQEQFMKSNSFADRSNRSQIATLHPYAKSFAQQFGLNPTLIQIANHGFNSTFKIKTDQGNYALRINTHSIRTPENIHAEVAWTAQLANSPVSAAKPHPAPTGEYVLYDTLPGHPRPLAAVCYHWLQGRNFPAIPTHNLYNSLALTTQYLHQNPPKLPSNAALPSLTDCCHDYDFRFTKPEHTKHLPLFQKIRDHANSALQKSANTRGTQVIHYDLHRLNLKRQKYTIHVLDFDDCLIAPAIMDMAITFYYFRSNEQLRNLEAGYWQSYGGHFSDFGLEEHEFEALIAGRRLYLINEFVAIPLANMQARIPAWIERSVVDFNNYLANGTFSFNK
ncbi:MAG: phosphotransferase enzyme family protein [Fimbriimonadaceae bacterium]